MWQSERARTRLVHHQKGFGARAGHDAIEQMDRLGYGRSGEIGFDIQGLAAQQSIGVAQRIDTLRHCNSSEIGAGRTETPHIIVGDQREDAIGSGGAVRIDRFG